ncbi:hypothetical protein SAFG77S_13257 [Streptomyces afghaniensis]
MAEEVDGRVVGVREVHQAVAVQQQGLHRPLAGQVDRSFEVPHAVRVVEGLAGVARGQLPAELVDEEEPCDEQELPDERRSRYRVGPRRRRLGAGIHPPALSVTVLLLSVRVRTDTPVYRYGRVPVHWRIDRRTTHRRPGIFRRPEESQEHRP